MAKKPQGHYSPEAIQARQNQARESYLAPLEKIVKNTQEQEQQPQVQKTDLRNVGIAARSLPKVNTPFETTPPDGSISWDYKTATTDMQGKPIERRTFAGIDLQPLGFDPNGNPYFGAGGVAWLKKWAYKLSEESATKAEADEAWNQYRESAQTFKKTFGNVSDIERGGQQASAFFQTAKDLFDATAKTLEGISTSGSAATGAFKSPVTAAIRVVNAAVGMTLEAFQFVSEVPERALGAQQAMREYANRTGSVLPSLTFDPVDDEYYQRVLSDPKLKSMYAPDNGFKANKDAADVLSRLISPLLSGYDAIRFWTSPGSVEEKFRAIQNGWTEGRMLYTELLKDTVKADYESRVKAGEDPVLLTMEMEDPWIEAGGEMLLDPLNALGLLGKAKKAGDTIIEAGRVVEQSGLLKNAEAIDLLKTIPKVTDPNEGARVAQSLVDVIKTEASAQARRIAQANDYKLFSYTPSANKIKTRKVVGNFVSAVTQAFRNTGRNGDDVLDYLNAVRKLSSNDDAQIIEGIAAISKSPLQTMAYNDAAFETGYMLNKILEDGDFINQMQKQGGDFTELAKWMDTKLEKATDFAFPSISEMSRAATEYDELVKVAGDVKISSARNAVQDIKNLDTSSSDLRKTIKQLQEYKKATKAEIAEEASQIKDLVSKAISKRDKTLKALDNQLLDLKTQAKAFASSRDGNLQFTNIIEDIRKEIKSLIENKKVSKLALSDDVKAARETAKNMTEIQRGQIEIITNKINDLQKQLTTIRAQRASAADSLSKVRLGESTVGDFLKKLDDRGRLAERFKELQKTNPGLVKFAQAQDFIDRMVKPINGFLANSYFSLSYGYAFRNAVQNMVTLWVDDGLMFTKEAAINFTKEGIKTPALDKFLLDQFGEIPQALRGKTMTQSMTGGSLWNEMFDKLNRMGYSPAALADAAEVYAGKMIYVKKYRQTMDKVADFGGMLPRLEEWQNAGFTTSQAQDFKDLFRANNYNAESALNAFAKKYGKGTVDKARVLDWVNAEAKTGLQQFENNWDEIVNYVNDENKTLPEIENFLEELKTKYRAKSQKAVNEVPRLDDRDPMVKILAEDKEKAGKYFNQDLDNQFTTMKIQANRAVSEFESALRRTIYELGKDPSEQSAQLAQDILQTLDSFPREVEDNIRVIDQTREWVIDRRNRALAKEDPNILWDEAVMGPKPQTGIITKDSFLKALWEDYYFPKRRGIWQGYYENKFSKYMDFAKAKPELSALFEKANYENIKFQQYADYVYSGGKIKAQVPQIVPASLGEAGNANNVRSLANAYGVTVPGAYTTPDKYVLNVINKYGDVKYERLEDVPLDVAEKVFSTKSGKPNMKYVKVEKLDTTIDQAARQADVEGIKQSEAYQRAREIAAQRRAQRGQEVVSEPVPMPEPEIIQPKMDDTPAGSVRAEFSVDNAARQADVEGVKQTEAYKKAKEIAAQRRAQRYALNETAQGMDVPPPHDPATSPGAHLFAENEQGYINAINHIRDGIRERWGLREAVGTFDPRSIMPDLVERVTIAKSKSQIVAEKFRDFALLPYGETKNMDLAMSLVYPYQFWYSRSYKNWMQRAFMTNPEIISRYANLKEAMAKEQKDLPDWWKSQLNITPGLRLLGADVDHPVYINLEATLFPLYGLTGTDFNDPQKRVNWWTATLDDMGKFGPSVWAPLQIATALGLAIQGENEAAARWGGRLIPQTASIKAASSFFGTPIELDPSVNLFSLLNGGELGKATDPYEEKRIGRALSKMVEEGIPEEALIEAARTQSGPLWDEAYRRAVQERAPGQLASFLFGVGFKGRTEQDKEIDQFYADYFRMQNLRDAGYLTKDEYAQAFNEMRQRYPFMDVVLLSRRTGESKDSAYAYNVIGRIPPGASTEILKAAGIDPETANKFYEAGGKFENMTESDKQRFMAGIIDLGAMLAIPSNTTREQWTAVRAQYNQITELQKQNYGDDILDRIDYYYSLKTEQEQLLFREANPEVIEAMNFRTQMIASNPNILPYYGGVETLERYYNNVMYDELEKTYGDKIFDLEEQYYSLYDAKDRKAFKAQHPELNQYFDARSKMKEETLFKLVNFGNLLPPAPKLQDVQPQNSTQEDIIEASAPPPQISFDQWQGILGSEVADQVMEYASGGDEPSYYARQELEYQAKQLGMSYPELLRLVMSSTNVVNYP